MGSIAAELHDSQDNIYILRHLGLLYYEDPWDGDMHVVYSERRRALEDPEARLSSTELEAVAEHKSCDHALFWMLIEQFGIDGKSALFAALC